MQFHRHEKEAKVIQSGRDCFFCGKMLDSYLPLKVDIIFNGEGGFCQSPAVLVRTVVSISACHAEDRGSIPWRGAHLVFGGCSRISSSQGKCQSSFENVRCIVHCWQVADFSTASSQQWSRLCTASNFCPFPSLSHLLLVLCYSIWKVCHCYRPGCFHANNVTPWVLTEHIKRWATRPLLLRPRREKSFLPSFSPPSQGFSIGHLLKDRYFKSKRLNANILFLKPESRNCM